MELVIALVALGLAFIFLEVFVPGGILGGLGTVGLIGACIVSYREFGLEMALFTFAGSAVLVAIVLLVQFKLIIPRTKLGKKLVNEGSIDAKNQYLPENSSSLIEQPGTALTALAPTGLVMCQDQQLEAYSQDGFIEKGTPVIIKGSDNFRILVKKATNN